jgi:2-phosphosulfolactate phosphatase
MTIDVLWTPSEIDPASVQDRTAVVIDVLRAGSTVAMAISSGARAVLPAASIEEAMRIAKSLGRGEVLLCGERQGVRIDGFDLGNSPTELSGADLDNRTIVMTTTNGTQALTALLGARRVYVGALVNFNAIAKQLRGVDGDLLIVCAGRSGRVSIEDALCAGMLVETLLDSHGSALAKDGGATELGDGAVAALALAEAHAPADTQFLRSTASGRALEGIGQGADIDFCARLDSVPEVPVLRDRQIIKFR